MSIVSLKFFMFIAATLLIYYICMPKQRWIVLLVASVGFFLAVSSLALLLVFLAMVMVTWGAGLSISRLTTDEAKKTIAGFTIALLATVLIFYKENVFFINIFNASMALFQSSGFLRIPDWIAPLGISYYTLILIGYILDLSWGTIQEPQKNPLKLLLFAGYFPQMTSGPFCRYNDMAPSLWSGKRFQIKSLFMGAQRIVWGLFKKLVIADRLAVPVSSVFDNGGHTGLIAILGVFAYVLQIYMDFSSCMDIVLGVSELFGISLAENFQRPFFSTSLSELWRKWHITLGLWLKDYVLYPVLKSRWMGAIRSAQKICSSKRAQKNIPTYIGMFITWFCVGFWHGGSWNYILGSGLFFFLMIVGGLLLKPVFKAAARALCLKTESFFWRLVGMTRTFLLFAFSISFGRAGSVRKAFELWRSAIVDFDLTVLADRSRLNVGLSLMDLGIAVAGLLVVFTVSLIQEKHGSIRVLLQRKSVLLCWALPVVLLIAVLALGKFDQVTYFMYGNF